MPNFTHYVMATMISAVVFGANPAWADYLEVRRKSAIKEAPERDAARIAEVEPLDILPLVTREQTRGYYNVLVPGTGQSGWIYRTLGRGFPGDPPTDITTEFEQRHVGVGKPQPYFEKFRAGYAVGYDARLKIPLWVQYEISPDDYTHSVDRSDDFRPDITLPVHTRASNSDYEEIRVPGQAEAEPFARGHMAPAGDMARSERVMSDSFYLSNMVPQVGQAFNSSVWLRLEDDIRRWVRSHGTAVVITGPVFRAEEEDGTRRISYRVIGGSEVAVPSHLFKIVVDRRDDTAPRALAFPMQNREYESDESYQDDQHRVSIDEIEELTDLDFLSALDDEIEEALEARTAATNWLTES